MKAKIRKLNKEVELPKYHTSESAGFDIASSADIAIAPGEVAKIPTGLVIAAPKGHFLLTAARSSLPLKKGLVLANGIGIIDPDYAGPNDEIHIIVHNFTTKTVEVKRGERLAQGIFLKTEQAEWEEMGQLRNVDRGGMGSTGGYNN
ncbi:MAG: dUTP diphosphatase [Candidatus Doudnabacteria bacterium]|nr:dUTP diphosphatase [Candidatus Doudnabacteria bacterium]